MFSCTVFINIKEKLLFIQMVYPKNWALKLVTKVGTLCLAIFLHSAILTFFHKIIIFFVPKNSFPKWQKSEHTNFKRTSIKYKSRTPSLTLFFDALRLEAPVLKRTNQGFIA